MIKQIRASYYANFKNAQYCALSSDTIPSYLENGDEVYFIDTGKNYYWDASSSSLIEKKPVNGLPSGGVAGQVLKKTESGVEWADESGGGSGGTTDYTDLSNKPQINGNTLTGNKTGADLGLSPTEVTISTAGAVTQVLDAGKIYHFTGALTALTITLNAPASGDLVQYHFDFLSGATAPTLTMPNTVTMPDSFTVEASKRYEIDVLNNYGVVVSWANS